jgi:hypothetical protein
LAPKAPFIVAEGQLEGYEDIWQNANRYNYSYLPYRFVMENGQTPPPPERNQAEPPIQAMATVMQMSLDAVRRTTSFDPALGQMPGRQMSADAIEALQKQGEGAHSSYLNAVRRSYVRLGEILVEAIPVYYDKPERVVQILNLEDEPSQVMLNAPHVVGPQGPQAVPSQTPQAKHFDLSKGKYSVTVDVGKNYATRRQEGVGALAELAQAAPELVPKFADLWVKEMDFPGAQAVAERLQPPGVNDPDLPPQAQAAIMQLQGENQQLKMAIATKQPQLQTQLQIAREKNASDLEKQRISTAGTMTVGLARVDAENQRSFVEAFETKLAHDEGFRLHFAKLATDALLAHQANVADAASQQIDHAHERVMAVMAHQHALEQGQQAADLAPPPQPAAS